MMATDGEVYEVYKRMCMQGFLCLVPFFFPSLGPA